MEKKKVRNLISSAEERKIEIANIVFNELISNKISVNISTQESIDTLTLNIGLYINDNYYESYAIIDFYYLLNNFKSNYPSLFETYEQEIKIQNLEMKIKELQDDIEYLRGLF